MKIKINRKKAEDLYITKELRNVSNLTNEWIEGQLDWEYEITK